MLPITLKRKLVNRLKSDRDDGITEQDIKGYHKQSAYDQRDRYKPEHEEGRSKIYLKDLKEVSREKTQTI